MKAVVDRIVQYANRYQLTNVETGEVLGTFDFDEVTGTVQQVGTEIDKELFDSIANDLAARVKLSGGELAETIVTFSDISGTAANVASGDTSATLWGKVKNWFSRLKALAFKNKVAAGDFEAGAIKNADVADDAAIAQSKVSGLMTDYVASISVSGRTVTYKNKNGVNMGSITTQDTTYGLASQSSNGLMSSTDKTKLDGIESGAQKNTVLGVKGGSESAYRTGNVNITKADIGLGNVDNTSDEDKPVSTATQTALNGKANTSGTYPNLTVGKATNADKATNAANATKATQDANGNVIDETYATKTELVEATGTKVKVDGTTQPEVNFTSDPQKQITANKNAIAEAQSDISDIVSGAQTVGKASQDADGNVIDTTYAKLSQVVTKDNSTNVISATTDAAKYFLRNKQVSTSAVAIDATGWYRIAKLPTYSSSRITVMKQYNYGRGVSLILDVASGSDTAGATTNIVASYAGMKGQSNYIDKIRYKYAGDGLVYIDVHIISGRGLDSYWLAYDGVCAYGTAFTSSQFALYDFQQTSDTGGTELPMPEDTGLATTGTIYQQGAPVFATDPSKLAPSTANGWTQTTATGTLPSAGVYMVSFAEKTGVTIGTSVLFFDGQNVAQTTIAMATQALVVIAYTPGSSTKWEANVDRAPLSLTAVYYKRIA